MTQGIRVTTVALAVSRRQPPETPISEAAREARRQLEREAWRRLGESPARVDVRASGQLSLQPVNLKFNSDKP